MIPRAAIAILAFFFAIQPASATLTSKHQGMVHQLLHSGGLACGEVIAVVETGYGYDCPNLPYDLPPVICEHELADNCEVDADGDGIGEVRDCDDADASIHPGADEYCDGVDNNCNGIVDERAVDETEWYADFDGDGYGWANISRSRCEAPSNFVDDGSDCDDRDASTNPGASEVAGDGVDNDCDGDIDESTGCSYAISDLVAGDLVISEFMANPTAVADSAGEWFEVYNASGCEADLDGLLVYDDGSNSFTISGSLTVADGEHLVLGLNADSTTNGGVSVDYEYSGFTIANTSDEIILDNGTEIIDEVWYDATWSIAAGYTKSLDPSAYDFISNDDSANWCDDVGTPGSLNNACAASADADGDGYDDAALGGTDCDDSDASVNPGASELCDGLDNDCDGSIDENAIDAGTWYADADGDGYGDAGRTQTACDQPTGYVADSSDCDDRDASTHPGAAEILGDGVDNDCDGAID